MQDQWAQQWQLWRMVIWNTVNINKVPSTLPATWFSSVTQSCPTLCDPMNCSTPGLPGHRQLPESTQTHVHWVGDANQPSYPLSSPSPPALNLSQHQGLSKESVLCIRWPKYWSFSFNISPSNEHPELISFRRLVGSLCSPRDSQESSPTHSSKASVLQHSAFFMVQYSHPYMTTGKITALAICTFVGKVMSLIFNMLLVSSGLFFSPKEQTSFNFMAAVTICSDFGAQENKACHSFHCFPIYLPWSDGTGCHDLCFLNVEF